MAIHPWKNRSLTSHVRRGIAIALAAPVMLVACSSGASTPGPASTTLVLAPGPAGSPDTTRSPAPGAVLISTVATGLDVPWGLAFLPDGTAVVAGRDDASITTISPTDGTVTVIGTISGVEHGGEGGLLGLAVSPAFARDSLLYVYYTAPDGNRIDTATLRDGVIGNQQIGVGGIPKAGIHNGGRMTFGPDGMLYVGTGDAGARDNAQNTDSLGGKILRFTPDLQPAPGNPGLGSDLVYSYGHRNVQGLAFDDRGRLWADEFGQNTWDELNLITAGGNYGWPLVEGRGARDGLVEPEREWATAAASPSGIAFWQGSIWMAGLRGQQLWQIPIIESNSGPATGEPIPHLTGVYGRLRTVQAAPDGSLWVTTSNTDGRRDVRDGDDRILRLELTG